MTRARRILTQNRLLVRQERLLERDLRAHFKALGDELEQRFSLTQADRVEVVVDQARPELADLLRNRMTQTAQVFGEQTFGLLEDIAKSYYGFERGPVSDPDAAAMIEQSSPFFDPLWRFTEAKEVQSFRDTFRAVIRSYFELHSLRRAVTIGETLKGEVRKVLQQGLEEGVGEAVTGRRLAQEFRGRISRNNAVRIARTEAHTAAGIGSDEAARSTGLELVKEWAAAEDQRTRASHAQADGSFAEIDEAFIVGGASLMFPGDPNGPAGEVINCRCTVLHLPIIDGQVLR